MRGELGQVLEGNPPADRWMRGTARAPQPKAAEFKEEERCLPSALTGRVRTRRTDRQHGLRAAETLGHGDCWRRRPARRCHGEGERRQCEDARSEGA